jgi:hemoglobin
MAESHKGQNLTRSDFNALVEDLIDAMDAEGISVPNQNRLIARLAPMRGEVIEK